MQRVLIVGCSGSGKSTLAKRLAALTGLPLVHLDAWYWRPGWRAPEAGAWRETVEALASRPAWIMDGNYSGTLALRLARADTLIHLDYPTATCLWRVLRRTARGFGTNRDGELAEGCPERWDWPFLKYILTYRRRCRPRDLARMRGFEGRALRFDSPARTDAFVAGLERTLRPTT